MAQLALGIAGAALGAASGMPFGAQIGWMIGAAIGGILDPQKQEGPRLSDLRLQKSSYGGMLPIVYGKMRTPGNVIWQTDLTEHEQSSGGKGGGPEVTTYTYTASFAIAFCEGPKAEVRRVWANGRLVYDTTQGSDLDSGDFRFRFYPGDEEQLPDPTMEAEIGAGQVPGYRGVCYCVWTDLELTEFGNSIPNIEAEIISKGATGCDALRFVTEVVGNEPVWGSETPPTGGKVAFTGGGIVDGSFRVTEVGGETQDMTGTLSQRTFLYDGTTLVGGTSISPATPDPFPQQLQTNGRDLPSNPGFGSDQHARSLGVYVMANGTNIPLWRNDHLIVSADGLNPAIAHGTLQVLETPDGPNGNYQYDPAGDFAYNAGVPAGLTVGAAVFSGNNRHLYVFTNDPDDPIATAGEIHHWYKIVDAEVTDQGTVIPPMDALDGLLFGTWGVSTTILGGNAASVENGGRYLWKYSTPNARITIYAWDASGNFTHDAACGFLSVVSTPGTGFAPSSIISHKNGYAVVVTRDAMVLATRFPVGQDDNTYLWEIVRDISIRSDLTDYDINVAELTDIVDGYIVTNQGAGRGMIEPLQRGYFFDAAEIDDLATFRKRGRTSVATIPDTYLAARVYGEEPPPPLTLVRTQELDLPRYLNLDYINGEADYQTGSQNAERQVTRSQSAMTITVPVVLTDDKAKAVASSNLIEAHLERDKGSISLSRKYARLTPTDVITVKGRDWRIKQVVENRPGVFKLDIVPSLAAIYIQPQVSAPSPGIGAGGGGAITHKAATDLVLLDVPFITEAEFPNGFYAAMAPGDENAWGGASLRKSNDGGASYAEVAQTTEAATMGVAATVLGDFAGGNVVDEVNSVTVVLQSGELAGTNNEGLLNGTNVAVLGEEVIYFRDAELVDEATYTLTGLLRGRRGTEWAMVMHEGAERFVVVPTLDVNAPTIDLGQSRLYKPVTLGATLDSATAQSFVNRGARLRPYSPVQLGGGIDADDGTILNWVPRTRIGGQWLDGGGPPIGEASERYIVEIWDASYTQCARIIEVDDATTTVYDIYDKIADFGADQETVYFTVAQRGAVFGVRARGTAPGAGASDNLPLAQIPPFQTGPLNPPPSGTVNATLTWSPTAPHYTAFAIGETYVAQFTAPGTSTVTVTVAEYASPPVFHHVKLTTDSAGLNMVPGTEQFGTTASAGPVVLSAGTYYFIVRCELADGTPSGPLGQDATMIIQLSHT